MILSKAPAHFALDVFSSSFPPPSPERSLDGRELESQAIHSGSSTVRLGDRIRGVYLVEVKQASHLGIAKFVQP
jgi:hypothetical protein